MDEDALIQEVAEANEEISRLRGALRFYAEPENWKREYVHDCLLGGCRDYESNSDAMLDGGDRARGALGLQSKDGVLLPQ